MTSRTWIGVAVLAALLVLPALLMSEAATEPLVRASFEVGPDSQYNFSIATRPGAVGPLPVHVAVLPGSSAANRSRTLLVWYDPAFPLRYASPSDVTGLAARVATESRLIDPFVTVEVVNTDQLLTGMAENPTAWVAMLGGATLPDSLLAMPGPLPLASWVRAGGTLVWAGGPIGFYDGHVGQDGGLVTDDLGWAGETQLLGFPLEDPVGDPSHGSRGWLYANQTNAVAEAFGLSYRGTGDGADVSTVVAHGGEALGYVTSPGAAGAGGARTSLAYVPLGSGGVFYFGGSVWTTGLGTVPSGDVDLSSDLALLLGTGIRVGGDTAASQLRVVDAGQAWHTELTLDSASPNVVAIVSIEASGVLLYYQVFERTVTVPAAASPAAADPGRRSLCQIASGVGRRRRSLPWARSQAPRVVR